MLILVSGPAGDRADGGEQRSGSGDERFGARRLGITQLTEMSRNRKDFLEMRVRLLGLVLRPRG